jgi:hypothetical protein
MGFSLQCAFAKKEMFCRESAVVLVTHQLQYLEQADLIVVLKQGEIQVQILLILFLIKKYKHYITYRTRRVSGLTDVFGAT